MNRTVTVNVTDFQKELTALEGMSKRIVRVRKLTNEILVNTGYHNKNLEAQVEKLSNAQADFDTIALLSRVYDYNKSKADEIATRLDLLLKMEGF